MSDAQVVRDIACAIENIFESNRPALIRFLEENQLMAKG